MEVPQTTGRHDNGVVISVNYHLIIERFLIDFRDYGGELDYEKFEQMIEFSKRWDGNFN